MELVITAGGKEEMMRKPEIKKIRKLHAIPPTPQDTQGKRTMGTTEPKC